jgi:hypothetical protein
MHSPDAGRFRWTTDSPFYVYATFHEPVFGFDINDVSASGGTVNLVEEQACARAPCLPSPPSTPSPTCSRRVEAPVRQLLGRAYIRTTVVPCYSDAQERGRQHTGWGNGSQRNSGGNSRWTHAPLRLALSSRGGGVWACWASRVHTPSWEPTSCCYGRLHLHLRLRRRSKVLALTHAARLSSPQRHHRVRRRRRRRGVVHVRHDAGHRLQVGRLRLHHLLGRGRRDRHRHGLQPARRARDQQRDHRRHAVAHGGHGRRGRRGRRRRRRRGRWLGGWR